MMVEKQIMDLIINIYAKTRRIPLARTLDFECCNGGHPKPPPPPPPYTSDSTNSPSTPPPPAPPPPPPPPKFGFARILESLLEQDMTLTQLSSRLDKRIQTISESITKLEAKGFVEKITSPDDKRCMLLHLTPSGIQTAQQYVVNRNQFNETFLSPLNDDEKQQLVTLLTKLTKGSD